MKPSLFNVLSPCIGGYIALNTLSHSLIELDKKSYSLLKTGEIDAFSQAEKAMLAKQGFIIDKRIDELAVLRRKYQIAKDSPEKLDLVIAPTLRCNFKCAYCFEDTNQTEKMSDDVASAIISFVESEIKNKPVEQIKVSWYGGEPLLDLNRVLSLGERIQDIAINNGIGIAQGIVTNGYLLSPAVVKKLINSGITHAQVTIDGLEKTHDERRILKSGEGTFIKIWNNLAAISKEIPDGEFTISIRFNTDKENYQDYPSLKTKIDSLGYKAFQLYSAIVEIVESKPDYQDKCLKPEEFSFFQQTQQGATNFEERLEELLEPRPCFCTAEKQSSYVIDPKGNCYNCWNEISVPDNALFNLNQPESMNPLAVSRYLGRDPFSEEDCSVCPYLPICSGGCPYERWVTGHACCVPERYEIENLLSSYVISE